jgi:hypothetical protein
LKLVNDNPAHEALMGNTAFKKKASGMSGINLIGIFYSKSLKELLLFVAMLALRCSKSK